MKSIVRFQIAFKLLVTAVNLVLCFQASAWISGFIWTGTPTVWFYHVTLV